MRPTSSVFSRQLRAPGVELVEQPLPAGDDAILQHIVRVGSRLR